MSISPRPPVSGVGPRRREGRKGGGGGGEGAGVFFRHSQRGRLLHSSGRAEIEHTILKGLVSIWVVLIRLCRVVVSRGRGRGREYFLPIFARAFSVLRATTSPGRAAHARKRAARRRRGRRVAAGGALVGARRARGLETVGCREVDDAAVVSLADLSPLLLVCVNLKNKKPRHVTRRVSRVTVSRASAGTFTHQ